VEICYLTSSLEKKKRRKEGRKEERKEKRKEGRKKEEQMTFPSKNMLQRLPVTQDTNLF
jgi:hypothetical protein